jgi:hypothetical protein
MTIKCTAIIAAILALAITPAAASAAESHAPTASGPTANGIIAILIGQFTPPIGSNKGSVVDQAPRPR